MSFGIPVMRCLAVVCLGLVSGLPGLSYAKKMTTGDTKTNNVIVELQEKLKKVSTCRSRVITRLRVGEEVFEIRDEGSYALPGKIRLERSIAEDMRQTIVVDGSLVWVHDQTENVVTRVNLSRVYKATELEADGDQPDPTRPFRGVQWESIRYQKVEALGIDLCRVFEATPKPMTLVADLSVLPKKVRFLVHPDDGLLRVVQYLGPDGGEIMSYRFEEVEVNPRLEDKVFEFVVPARALVMDATDDTVELLKAAAKRVGGGD